LEDTIMTTEQKIICAKVGLLILTSIPGFCFAVAATLIVSGALAPFEFWLDLCSGV
jgi:hypothetical protein